MALTYTVNAVAEDDTGGDTTIVSGTLALTTGDIVTVIAIAADNAAVHPFSISNSGTALTWNTIASTNTANQCKVHAWWASVPDDTDRTVTVTSGAGTPVTRRLYSIVHTGAHATTPVPAGNIFSGIDTNGDTTQSITPTSSGSCLWMAAGDWNATNTYAAASNCTLQDNFHDAGQASFCLIRPTTQPRTDASAFTIGQTDTGATNAWVAFEVQAAAGAAAGKPPASLFNQQALQRSAYF